MDTEYWEKENPRPLKRWRIFDNRTWKIFAFLILVATPSRTQDLLESWQAHRDLEAASMFNRLPWISIGPTFQGGRVETIDCPVDQPGVIYVGFGSGGLWKTTNQGLTWELIFGHEATHSIGDVAVSVSNPQVVYLGTGENLRASQGFAFPGTGVYRSDNGGQTWTHLGLSDTHHIGRVVVDPTDPALVFVAALGHFWTPNAQRGLYVSHNGGRTWDQALYINDSIGVVDVAWDAANQILYAATWEMPAGRGSGLYKSVNLGKDWERLEHGFPVHENLGRIGLTISPTHPGNLYACLDNRNQILLDNQKQVAGLEVYRSRDHGESWTITHKEPLGNYSGFGWSFGDIRVSPTDRNEIYVLGIHLLRSLDGGKTFERMGGQIHHLVPSPAKTLHLDQHDLYLDPMQSDRMILGNDGGVYISVDQGENWFHTNNLPAAEFYDLAVENISDQPYGYGGTQDNSSLYGPIPVSRPSSDLEPWQYVWLDPWSGGDGFTTLPDPIYPNRVYFESQNGYLNRKDLTTGVTTYIRPNTDDPQYPLRTHWFTPYILSIHYPSTLYFGAHKVYKSMNSGDNWLRISHDLTYSADPVRKSRSLSTLVESPLSPGLLYAGTEKGAVWISRDDGINWIEISQGLPYKMVNYICPSRHKKGRLFLVMKGMDDDDYSSYLFQSDNHGKSWNQIDTGLPEEPVNCILEDPLLESMLLVGTNRGVYLTPDLGMTWTGISGTLPTLPVMRIRWADQDRYLVAATHGGSLYCCFAEPIRHYLKTVDPSRLSWLGFEEPYRPTEGDFQGDLNWDGYKPMILYWYQPDPGMMTLEVLDSNETIVYSEEINGLSGFNVWEWDLIINENPDPGLYPIPEYKIPDPGSYQIKLLGQGSVLRSTIRVY